MSIGALLAGGYLGPPYKGRKLISPPPRKKKGMHAITKSGLRPLKVGEEIIYAGGNFWIVKKETRKRRKRSKQK